MSDIASEPTTKLLDGEQIDLLLSLDDGEGAVLAEIVGEFLTTSDEMRAQLLRALEDGDLPDLERAAHTLKGASANVGAAALSKACAQVETQARAGEEHGLELLTDEFETQYAGALDALRALIRDG